METSELIRERHHPDWNSIFLGAICIFAFMGAISLLGTSLRVWQLRPTDSRLLLIVKLLYAIVSMIIAMFLGGYITGRTLDLRGRVNAAMNGLLVWELGVIGFGAASYFGYSVLPGIVFNWSTGATSWEGSFWILMGLAFPLPFATVFGAMTGNDKVHAPLGQFETQSGRALEEGEPRATDDFLNVA